MLLLYVIKSNILPMIYYLILSTVPPKMDENKQEIVPSNQDTSGIMSTSKEHDHRS